MANLVRVKDKFQITLPVGARRQSEVREGDYLEVSVTDEGGFLLRPQQVLEAGKRQETMLAFLHRSRGLTRPRKDIDQGLEDERASWGK